jgi:hypothetical protein
MMKEELPPQTKATTARQHPTFDIQYSVFDILRFFFSVFCPLLLRK